MEPYLVSFRRHRPDSFLSVVGQTHITQTLKNAIRTDKLAQAMLFCGPRGVGKTTCARILAKAINCLQPTDEAEACGTCKSCASIRDGGSLAIYELDAASNNSVDDIRNLVEQVRYPPQGGKFKVYIIDEVHMLSTAAFNAFLKTLEEPPHYAIFILATTEKHKILPTILSRCQVYQFNRIRIPDIAGELERVCRADNIPFEEQALYSLAEKADGALRDALS
ncbi:MAG: DNA polymerase III subunit gamma/tau, partial [Bacteroidetes bacterium]|nr:DNA polymerase III subunit gamma/tau [Bacteroidota bacterium]